MSWLDDLANQLSQFGSDAVPSDPATSSDFNPAKDSQSASSFFDTFFGRDNPDTSASGNSSDPATDAFSQSDSVYGGSNASADGNTKFAGFDSPKPDTTLLQGIMNKIGLKKTSDGSLDYSDPATIDKLLKLIMAGGNVMSALMNKGNPVGYKTAAQLQAEIKSPLSNWTPQQQANADAFFGKQLQGPSHALQFASAMPNPITPGHGYARGGRVGYDTGGPVTTQTWNGQNPTGTWSATMNSSPYPTGYTSPALSAPGVVSAQGAPNGVLTHDVTAGTSPRDTQAGASGYSRNDVMGMWADPTQAANTPFAQFMTGTNAGAGAPLSLNRGRAMLGLDAMNAGYAPDAFSNMGQFVRATRTASPALQAHMARNGALSSAPVSQAMQSQIATDTAMQAMPGFTGSFAPAPAYGASSQVASPIMKMPIAPGMQTNPGGSAGYGFARGGSTGPATAQHGALGHVNTNTGGQDDVVPANLAGGEYVMDADTVSALGDGNNAAGAKKLDTMRKNIRTHKRSAPANKIPPRAKSPQAYMGSK